MADLRRFRCVIPGFVILVIGSCVTGVPETDLAEVYFQLGNAYFDLDQYDNAVNAFAQALRYDDTLVKAGYNLAHVYLETGRIEEAKSMLDELLEDDPDNSLVLSTLAWAYYLEGDLERALTAYRRVNERLAGDSDSLYNTAVLLWEVGEYEEALASFLKLYELAPDPAYLSSIAELYEELGDYEKAIAYLELVTADSNEATDERLRLARLYREVAEYGKSVATYQELREGSEEPDPRVEFELGSVLLIYIEDFEMGIDAVRTALVSGFKDQKAMQQLAESAPPEIAEDVIELLLRHGFSPEEDGATDTQDDLSGVPVPGSP